MSDPRRTKKDREKGQVRHTGGSHNAMESISLKTYAPVGHCIYCGCTTNLEREHIIPFGLDGTAVLPKSTCRTCAKLTGRQEEIVLRGPMWAIRVYRELRSRTKHRDAPKTYPLTVIRHEAEEVVDLPAQEYPILLHFPTFAAPAFLRPEGYKSGIRLSGMNTIALGPPPEEVARRLGATSISLTQEYEPVAFARVVAKIAYATAAAEGLLKLVEGNPYIVQSILGSVDDIGRWVGTIDGPVEAFAGQLHRILFHRDDEQGLLLGEVQLFSDSQAPRYGVILGKLAPVSPS